ncbi:MAG TPA: histidine kinase [Flavobacteriaceae bacterium]|nr:histidine kinase [Flavobacteriaceae bacterium]
MQKIIQNKITWITVMLIGVAVGYYFLLRHVEVSHFASLSESVGTYFGLLIFIFGLKRLQHYYHSRSAINIVYLGIITVLSLLIALLVYWYGSGIGLFDVVYRELRPMLFFIRWFFSFLILLIASNLFWIDENIKEQSLAFDHFLEKERQLTKAEMNNLQQQFQPHFLFNSLNSINALLGSQPEKAREMLFNLSEFLRMTLKKGKKDFTDVSEEIDYLNLYLAIEKVRFGERLSVDIEKKGDCTKAQLPSLILQPILENAIKYGRKTEFNRLKIDIFIHCKDSFLMITVKNPYDADDVHSPEGTGFGLESIERNLKFLYKQDDLLEIEKFDNIFSVTLKIPQ